MARDGQHSGKVATELVKVVPGAPIRALVRFITRIDSSVWSSVMIRTTLGRASAGHAVARSTRAAIRVVRSTGTRRTVGSVAAVSERRTIDAVPAPVLVLGGIATTQLGASLAKRIFDEAGPRGTVFLRVVFAAVLLTAIWTPRWRNHSGAELGLALAFGVSLAFMNLTFYESIDRIPQGVAVTIEFAGPLTVAVLGSRRALDLVWVTLAAAGHRAAGQRRRRGHRHASARRWRCSPACSGAPTSCSARAWGRPSRAGGAGAGDVCRRGAPGARSGWPVAARTCWTRTCWPSAPLVAVLSSAIPYSLELEALRRLPTGVFGVLMSLEPAVAALAGLVVLGEVLHAREWVAIALVVAASAGAAQLRHPRNGGAGLVAL